MKHLNLLPDSVRQHKTLRKLKISMAVSQLGIFALLFLVLFLLTSHQKQLDGHVIDLATRIQSIDQTYVERAIHLETAIVSAHAFEDFFETHVYNQIETWQVEAIFNALPHGVALSQLHFSGGYILLTGEATGLLEVGVFRDALMDIFTDVISGSMVLQDSGNFRFGLRVQGNA